MRYRKTVDGLLEVSAIGIGTYALAGVYGDKDPLKVKAVLEAAYDRGVTFFDTASAYGDAEALLGEALGGMRDRVVISTKVPACLGEVSCSYDTIVSGCEKSLESLKTDYIDIYQIHFDDGRTPTAEVVRAFESLKTQGKIRTYGIGHVSPERAAEYLDKGLPSTVMGELNAVSRTYYLRMLPLIETSGAGYIGFSLTGRGILTDASLTRGDFSPGDIRQMDAVFEGERRRSGLRIRDEFQKAGREIGSTSVQVAIAWAISQKGVLTGLVGPSTMEHLDEDVGAADIELDPRLRDRLDCFLEEEAIRLRRLLAEEVASILDREIEGVEEGATALVYAIEALADLGFATDEDLVTRMGSVIKIMKSGQGEPGALDAIRKDLLRHVKTT